MAEKSKYRGAAINPHNLSPKFASGLEKL